MWLSLSFNILRAAYWAGGRTLIKAAVDNPNKTWDDTMMSALDALLAKEND